MAVRFTEDEADKIRRASELGGTNPSEFIRLNAAYAAGKLLSNQSLTEAVSDATLIDKTVQLVGAFKERMNREPSQTEAMILGGLLRSLTL